MKNKKPSQGMGKYAMHCSFNGLNWKFTMKSSAENGMIRKVMVSNYY